VPYAPDVLAHRINDRCRLQTLAVLAMVPLRRVKRTKNKPAGAKESDTF
jgi:hypothetical protein